jgi:glycosyltransferase involved in cell wall biosynthesis
MRKVLIGTPCYDGRAYTWYMDSLLATVRESINRGVHVHVVYPSYDSLIQRARNTLFRIAIADGWDDLFFIDSDTRWSPEEFFRLLERPEPIVGAALVRKADTEGYTVKLIDKSLKKSDDGKLIEVDGVGTGFMRITRFALEKLWNVSEPYDAEGQEHRMICDIRVVNRELISEDYVIANKWRSLGYKTWLDPSITIQHVGTKKYEGDFQKYIEKNGYT